MIAIFQGRADLRDIKKQKLTSVSVTDLIDLCYLRKSNMWKPISDWRHKLTDLKNK